MTAALLAAGSFVSYAQQARSVAALPEAPSAMLAVMTTPDGPGVFPDALASLSYPAPELFSSSSAEMAGLQQQQPTPADGTTPQTTDPHKRRRFDITEGTGEVDANGRPIDRTREQPKRILGFIPNYRAVSATAKPAPPGLRTNFRTATKQAFDVSSFGFLLITSASAYGINQHPSLNTYNGGDAVFWAYLWRGFVDKTDGTYIGSFILPTVLHEDTRYYAMGPSHTVKQRALYAATRFAIAKTYSGHNTPNIASLGGRVATQYISTFYYPPGSQGFGVLAEKYAFSIAREAGFTVLREFSPEVDRFLTRHRHHDTPTAAPAKQAPDGVPQGQE